MKKEENKLTDRQQDTYNFIYDFIIEKGYSPSLREIAQGIYVSKPVALRHVNQLKEKGFINFTPHIARSIVLLILCST